MDWLGKLIGKLTGFEALVVSFWHVNLLLRSATPQIEACRMYQTPTPTNSCLTRISFPRAISDFKKQKLSYATTKLAIEKFMIACRTPGSNLCLKSYMHILELKSYNLHRDTSTVLWYGQCQTRHPPIRTHTHIWKMYLGASIRSYLLVRY